MSKFRKVSETENLPSFIEKRFIGASVDIEEDPYAELKKNSVENKIKISKQEIGMKKEATNLTKSWEKISGASVYEDLRPQSFEERLSSHDYGSIRRSDYGFDQGENARTTTSGLQAFSQDDYMNAMLSRSASIFNPDMISLSEEFLNSQESTSAQSMLDQAQKREAKASRHNTWEEKKLNSIRQSSVVNSRAHSILRTSNENEFNSSFGMIDPDKLDERESLRVANQSKTREQRLAVKKNITEGMVNNSQQRAKTIRDIYNSVDLNFDDID
jgi:hypothetical protein